MEKYRDYLISTEFKYTSGKADFHVYPPHGEFGIIQHYTTLETVKGWIDEEIAEKELSKIKPDA